ncbi:MAG: ATP-dependent sacrificial sulfur transferase LarE [Tissierellia bacterium]|nr:ATP-dependent sacrificial sulfur transferase LarE [Tissierellia bacterium]
MKDNLDNKINNLKNYLLEKERVTIAFSGGVDSSFLLKFANEILKKENVLGVFVNTKLQNEAEKERVYKLAKDNEFNLEVIDLDPFELKEFKENSKERCYYCKSFIFESILKLANSKGFYTVLDGTNYDDINEYRPGVRALKEMKIESPLRDFKFTKKDIRKSSKALGLFTAEIESSPCLATRVPYGIEITPMVLSKVDKCEVFLRVRGYKGLRVRAHENLARIELKTEDIEKFILNDRESTVEFFKRMGFDFVTLDLAGYQKGSFDNLDGDNEDGQ